MKTHLKIFLFFSPENEKLVLKIKKEKRCATLVYFVFRVSFFYLKPNIAFSSIFQ